MKQFNQNLATRISIFLSVAMLALLVTTPVIWAQGGARVYIQPLDSVEGTLTVDVIAENVTDMYGAEFRLMYDPTVLAVQDVMPDKDGVQIEPGTLLPANKGFIVANEVDEATGTVTFALTLLNPAPAVTGSGPLAQITFKVLNSNPSTINIERAKLVAIDLQTIANQTVPLSIGNVDQSVDQLVEQSAGQPVAQQVAQSTSVVSNNSNISQAGSSQNDFPWWIVAAGIMILGLLGLVAIVFMTGLNKPQNSNQPRSMQYRQPQMPPQPSRPTTRTRPSAFK